MAIWKLKGVPNSGMDDKVVPYCQQPVAVETHEYQVGALVQEGGKVWRKRMPAVGDSGFSATRQAYTE
jgi:hypothetical protein